VAEEQESAISAQRRFREAVPHVATDGAGLPSTVAVVSRSNLREVRTTVSRTAALLTWAGAAVALATLGSLDGFARLVSDHNNFLDGNYLLLGLAYITLAAWAGVRGFSALSSGRTSVGKGGSFAGGVTSRCAAAASTARRSAPALDPSSKSARGRFLKQAASFTPHVSLESRGQTFFVSTADRRMGKFFVSRNRTEARVFESALQTLDEAGVDLAFGTFIDCGANIGTTTLAALRAGFSFVLACEPAPTNARLLRANVALNDAFESVSIIEVALSNRSGMAWLDFSRGLSKSRLLSPLDDQPRGAGAEVRLTRLDDLAAEGAFDPADVGFLWLDVEGHEAHVFEGAGLILERSPPVVMELYPKLLRLAGMMESLPDMLARHYSHVADLRSPEHKLVPIDLLSELIDRCDKAKRHTDLLLCKVNPRLGRPPPDVA
jgi:FkbM family methyltransferase